MLRRTETLEATHSLVLDNFATFLQFPLLHHVGVSLHAVDGKGLGETVGDQCVGMQTGQSDELPDETKLGQLPDVFLHVLVVQSGCSPVKRGRQV